MKKILIYIIKNQKYEVDMNKEQFDFPKLDLMQESYLTAHLELCYNIELPNNLQWFKSSKEVLDEC